VGFEGFWGRLSIEHYSFKEGRRSYFLFWRHGVSVLGNFPQVVATYVNWCEENKSVTLVLHWICQLFEDIHSRGMNE
jgi:hypothetical protein